MTDYRYDGSFDGFLCCVHAHYYLGKASSILSAARCAQQSFLNIVEIETDPQRANLVYNAIGRKISPYDLRRVYRIFLAEAEQKEMQLLDYIRLGFIKGGSVSSHHGHPVVRNAELLEKKVTQEVCRLKGLVRFSVPESDILYAKLEPDNDVLELLANHFADRYKNDPFIIHDLRREKALIAGGGHWYISAFQPPEAQRYDAKEIAYRRLWKEYFENIAIKERTNPRCQRLFMPMRYRKHLTETQQNP